MHGEEAGESSMKHEDHVGLLRAGVQAAGGIWADFGSGEGAFTLALADLLGQAGTIYSIDRDGGALQRQEHALRRRFPNVAVTYRCADFVRPLGLPPLDGVVMANSLHFQLDKEPVLALTRGCLKPSGRLILVEYDTDQGNPWVPYPLSFASWSASGGLAARCGFVETRLLAAVPSRFLRRIYAALSRVRCASGGSDGAGAR